jgi:hypothetical protein
MNTPDSFEALRDANPRTKSGFPETVAAASNAVVAAISSAGVRGRARRARQRRRLVGVSAVGASLAAGAVAVLALTVSSVGRSPGVVEDAAAAIRKAATLTAASAERSGTAVVRISENGEPWAGSTIRWHAGDLSVARDVPHGSRKAGAHLLVVDGMMFGVDPRDGGWVELGSPASVDPDSGTTPAEYLAAVHEDVGGATFRRITAAMKGFAARDLADGSRLYTGTVAARSIARKTGFKEGQAIRVLPFGYVAHGAAADPRADLKVAFEVGADGILREIAVTWGTVPSAWTYTVSYESLGSTEPLEKPANARPFPDRRP